MCFDSGIQTGIVGRCYGMLQDQEEQLEKLTAATLLRVVDFLKFSETKNGALVTFASAWVLGLIALLSSEKPLPFGFRNALVLSIPFFLAAALFGLWSFFPKIRLSAFTRLHSVRHEPNLLFFGDVSSMKIDEYANSVRKRYLPPEGHASSEDYMADLCVQISVNSSIAIRKFRLFNRGLYCVLGALAILAIPILQFWLVTARSLIWD